MFALIWSYGGPLDDVGRTAFGLQLRKVQRTALESSPASATALGPATVPDDGSVFDHFWAPAPRLTSPAKQRPSQPDTLSTVEAVRAPVWRPWSGLAERYRAFLPAVPVGALLVPTGAAVSALYIRDALAAHAGHPVLLTGGPGCGKSLLLRTAPRPQSPNAAPDVHTVVVHFSPDLTAPAFAAALVPHFLPRRRGVLGPVTGTCVICVDDMHLGAAGDAAVPALEALRGLAAQRSFYIPRTGGAHVTVADTRIAAAARTPPLAGAGGVSLRVLRWFHVLQLPTLEEADVRHIVHCLLGLFLATAPEPVATAAFHLGPATELVAALYVAAVAAYSPHPHLRPHPVHGLRRLLEGLLRTDAAAYVSVTGGTLYQLLCHEGMREFGDGLTDARETVRFRDQALSDLQVLPLFVFGMESSREAVSAVGKGPSPT